MLNKLQFNNLVITNKQKIQRVKTHTIQRLVKKLKNLKLLLEKKPDDQKSLERFRKNTLCLEELKKLKRMDLIKHALVSDKNSAAVLTNSRSSPEEVAVALAASNKIMIDLMKHFREQLQLKDDDSSWKKEIMRTSKRRMKINRTEKKRQKRKDLKDQKALARKREEWLKNQHDSHRELSNGDEEVNENMNISTLGIWKVEPIESELKPKQELPGVKSKTVVKKIIKNITSSSKTKVENTQEERKTLLNKEEKVKDIQKGVSDVLSKRTRNEQISKIKVTRDETATNNLRKSFTNERDNKNDFENLFEKSKTQKNDTATENVTHVIDPFFITQSGENYHSTAVIVRDGKLMNPTFPVESRNIWKGGNDEKRKYNSESQYGRKNHAEKSFDRRGATKRNPPKSANNDNLKGLHPSWIAKQKQKPVITAFQGKKIKIDESYEIEHNYNKNRTESNSITTIAKQKITDKSKANEIHPSWEAKQKMKPIIADFKGKKITFEDNENAEDVANSDGKQLVSSKPKSAKRTAVPNTNLHPSWAAKQKLKPAITAFEGKKIKFDDDYE